MSIAGYLYSWIDTGIPGYREFEWGGPVTVTMTEGYYRWPDYITQLSADMTALDATFSAAWDVNTGKVTLTTPGPAAVQWTDRIGWMLGFDAEPFPDSHTEAAAATHTSRNVCPGAIPLFGATFEEVDLRRERSVTLSRFRRGYGYVYGGARIWRWSLTIVPGGIMPEITEQTTKALLSGFASSGKVSIWMGDSTPYSAAALGGMVDGYVIGLENIERLSEPYWTGFRATLLMATGL